MGVARVIGSDGNAMFNESGAIAVVFAFIKENEFESGLFSR